MSESNSPMNVPEMVHQSLLPDKSDVETKVGHVAKFDIDENKNDLEENNRFINYKKEKDNNQFIGLTKEELQSYINNPKWKRIRWIIGIIYILILILLLVGSVLLILFNQRCPPKPKLVWYEKDIIYEIDVTTFFDSNDDAIGDIKGVQQKLDYLEINNIKSILFHSSIFNVTSGTSIKLDGNIVKDKKVDLLTIDPLVGNENDLQDFIKVLGRRDMHLIIDLPLSSTSDPNGNFWYGSNQQLINKINNPCTENPSNLGCQYYQLYGRLPLDFNDPIISNQSQILIDYWLSKNKIDGIRVNLPLIYNSQTREYNISYQTIQQWNQTINNIAKKTKPKLFLIDVPFGLQDLIKKNEIHNKIAHPLLLNQQTKNIDAQLLTQRLKSFENKNLSKPLFWQLGSRRRSDEVGIINKNDLSKEIVLTISMLISGTPIVLYGEEIDLDQKLNPLMSWTPDPYSGGFTSCSTLQCKQILSTYQINSTRTSVKREEALGGQSKDSLLKVFRHLSKLRQSESFQFGVLESNYDVKSNIFWFIREAPGYRGYIVLFNLNKNIDDLAHISLYEMTKHDVPLHIHYEYQWPKSSLSTSKEVHIDSDNLFIHPQSINIFWWAPKLIKPKILLKNAKEHSNI